MEFKKGIPFDHSHHLGTLKRGKQLRCTSCHSQIVQGSHMTVTDEVCYVCHFKPEPDGTRDPKLSNCRTCHVKGVANPRAPQEHALFIERGTDCTRCHFDVIRGKGIVPHQRCESCHANPEYLSVSDPALLHRTHVTDHNVACYKCHEPIQHHLETPDEITGADCGICHAQRHQLQKEFYAGEAHVPFGKPIPGAMIEAHIACTGCHAEMESAGKPTSATAMRGVAYASGRACDYCHGPGYDNLLQDWHREITRRSSQMGTLARIADSTLNTTETRDVCKKIRDTLDVIRDARAVHNIGYAAELIGDSQAALVSGTTATAVGSTVQDLLSEEMASFRDAPSCLQRCHYGISQHSNYLKNQDRIYPHAPHVNVARIDCGVCHSREIHKVNLPRGYECISCHHERAKGRECTECHRDVYDFAKGDWAGYNIASEQILKCDSCHKGAAGEVVMLNSAACQECHPDSKAYLDKLQQQKMELRRLDTELTNAVNARWNALDFPGLQTVDQLLTVERVNGIHNFPLAKKLYESARQQLSGYPPATTSTTVLHPRDFTPRAQVK